MFDTPKLTRERKTPFPTSEEDVIRSSLQPHTPQTQSPVYELAFHDPDFLCREELRPVRLQLELLKPELILQEHGITSTVVLFGGARIPAPGAEPGGKTEIAKKNLAANSNNGSENLNG